MKLPNTFLPKKNLDTKVKKYLEAKKIKEYPKCDRPAYAVLDNGDYLQLNSSFFKVGDVFAHANFEFTINGKQHNIEIFGEKKKSGESNIKLDGEYFKVKEKLVSGLFKLAQINASRPDITKSGSIWELEMLYATEVAYEGLVELLNKYP